MSIPIRIDDELRDRIDDARGDVPRERFARVLLGEALDARARASLPSGGGPPRSRGKLERVPSSAEARGAVKPIPKAGSR